MIYSLQFELNKPFKNWDREDCFSYLFGLQKTGIKLGLENIRRLLDYLKNPQDRFKSIHVAGTNGKGSTALLLSSVLEKSDYHVGLYTSPHLIHFSERIRVNGLPVTETFLLEQIRKVACAVGELFLETSEDNGGHPTYFEFGTALAFCCFAEKGVDIAVIETGMGGRLDATNVITPVLSVITNIGLEHQEYLGPDLPSIAAEKAGIIKERVPVVTGEKKDEIIDLFKDVCKNKKTDLFCVNSKVEKIDSGLWGQKFTVYNQASDRKNKIGHYTLNMSLAGDFQLANAQLVLAALELLEQNNFPLKKEAISEGFSFAVWPGRMHVLSKDPLIILDGAHNLQAIQELKNSVSNMLKGKDLTIVFGILGEKDIENIMGCLFSQASEVFISTPQIDRGACVEEVYRKAKSLFPDLPIFCFDSLQNAFQEAISKNNYPLLVTGSLYTVGEILEYWQTIGCKSRPLVTPLKN